MKRMEQQELLTIQVSGIMSHPKRVKRLSSFQYGSFHPQLPARKGSNRSICVKDQKRNQRYGYIYHVRVLCSERRDCRRALYWQGYLKGARPLNSGTALIVQSTWFSSASKIINLGTSVV
jgi:hypothetical protein